VTWLISLLVGLLLLMWVEERRRRKPRWDDVIPITEAEYGRACPICGADASSLCRTKEGIVMMCQVHTRRSA